MVFKDFENNPQDLVGKTVLYEGGMSYSDQRNRSLIKITKVTKTGFRLETTQDRLFSLSDGEQKGLHGRMNMGVISRCTLLTEDEVNVYRKTWKRNREMKTLKEEMKIKFETLTFEQLEKFRDLI